MFDLKLERREVNNFVEINDDPDEVAGRFMRIYNHFSL